MASPTLAFHKEFLWALCVSANARGGRRNVVIANLSIETWFIAANCWHLIIFRCGETKLGSSGEVRGIVVGAFWEGSSQPDPPSGCVKSTSRQPPKGEEGTIAHWGGQTSTHHLILRTTLFPCWSQSSSQTSTWTTGGDWTRCCCSRST